jgi:AcrR family transcriptional regulator
MVTQSPTRKAGRRETLLDATCTLIARTGTRTLRIEDVAREAGVSIGLVYYYFDSRDELIASAFEHANQRAAEEFALRRKAVTGTGLQQVVERLLSEFADDENAAENWMVWIEMTAGSATQPRLREMLNEAYASWTAEVFELLEDGRADGSVPLDVNSHESALRLTASMDGLGSRMMTGAFGQPLARALALETIERELGVTITTA